ncbi:MAG: hypothetical protein RBS39_12705 [Phycisphaerales bacterium]|jgi:hypothetical protein|nr:hypothetical protein [Phycisphaerales bacterium]
MTGVDRDILISRVIDGEATPEDWTALRAMAERDASIWSDLVAAQQDHAELCAIVSRAADAAEHVDVPVLEHMSERVALRTRRVGAWMGWAAAAAIALTWAGMGGFLTRPARVGADGADVAGVPGAGLVDALTPDQALAQYYKAGQAEGRVLGELPERVVLEAVPTADGRVEVRFVRQIVERAIVHDLYRVGEDEAGNPVPVRRTATRQGVSY